MRSALLLPLLCLCAAPLAAAEPLPRPLTTPTPRQALFMEQELGVFFHFTLNTFCGDEHGDGGRPATLFDPAELDADQWILAAKAMGARYAVLTARHEDGFCLWPTATTDYCVRNSPWRDGAGDVVGEFVAACRRHGLRPGLYFSPNYNAHELFRPADRPVRWGAHWDSITRARFADRAFYEQYKALELEQVRELCTRYGELFYFWMDHWNDNEVCREVTDLLRRLQPECLLSGPDVRHPGTERGIVGYPMWNAVRTVDGTPRSRPARGISDPDVANDYGLLETDLVTGEPLGPYWRSVECPTDAPFSHGGWFWHGPLRQLPPERLLDYYYRTVGLGANLLVNLPPDRRGLIPGESVAAATAFGRALERFAGPYAGRADSVEGYEVELRWERPCRIDHILLEEELSTGQRVISYTLEAWVEGRWQALTPANAFLDPPAGFNSSPGFATIGHKKIDRVQPVTTNRLRWRCLRSVQSPPRLRRFAAWSME